MPRPTLEMQREALRGLRWRARFNRGGTAIGVARARDIANGRNLSPDTVRRMASFFKRHAINRDAPGFYPGEKGYPSAGRIAWALWGGDAALPWIEQHLPQPNPVPVAKSTQLRKAEQLYEDFSGHEAEVIGRMPKPVVPDVALAIGEVDGILYSTIRNGKVERYIHRFKAKSRPLLASSHDGKQLYLLGGAYDFTERGIVDKT